LEFSSLELRNSEGLFFDYHLTTPNGVAGEFSEDQSSVALAKEDPEWGNIGKFIGVRLFCPVFTALLSIC